MERATLSGSYPFLSIARHYGLPYWVVLTYADHLSTPSSHSIWRTWAIEQIGQHFVGHGNDCHRFVQDVSEGLKRIGLRR